MRNVRLSRTLLRNYGDPGSPCYLLLEIAPAKPSALSPEPREFSFLGPRCSRNLGSGWLTLCPSLDYGCLTTKSTKVCQRRRECLISSRGKLVVTLPWIVESFSSVFGILDTWISISVQGARHLAMENGLCWLRCKANICVLYICIGSGNKNYCSK